ncbi:hypothetical protein [Promicromonospora sp. NPDC050262]|uniref:hypothetical protein n=1 Tax=Promicromonospora sp. NPDC050262 TaxID=3155036 RepID=UPI0033F7024C
MRSGWFEEATARSAVGHEARTVAWEATPLGPPSTWPESLRHAVRLCFSTRFPVMMVWGPDLTLIYNDGYRDMLGTAKHPAALGASARVVWAEIWDDIGPLFDTVLATGKPTLNEDLYLLMNRSGTPRRPTSPSPTARCWTTTGASWACWTSRPRPRARS